LCASVSLPKSEEFKIRNFLTLGNNEEKPIQDNHCMNIQEQIKKYIAGQPVSRRADIEALHERIVHAMPRCKLWFLDGKDGKGKIVSNPQIGYGLQTMKYADGKTKEFYQIGISSNTTGISVYVMGMDDKSYLLKTYGKAMGKASITGYCIKFRTLSDINIDTLEAAIKDGATLMQK
jgi:hypothetical protein